MSHSHGHVFPRPVGLGWTSVIAGILFCIGLFFLFKIWLPWYASFVIVVNYFIWGYENPGALFGNSITLFNKLVLNYYMDGISWNPFWFAKSILVYGTPRSMANRVKHFSEKYATLEKREITIKGEYETKLYHPAAYDFMEGGATAVDDYMKIVIESSLRPFVKDQKAVDLWSGVITKRSLEEQVEKFIAKNNRYKHDDLIIEHLAQDRVHLVIEQVDPGEDFKKKWSKVDDEAIERISEEANINTVIKLLGKFADKMKKKGIHLDPKTLLDRFQAERDVIDVTVEDRNFNVSANLDPQSASVLSGLLNNGVKLDTATQAALISAIAAALKSKK